MNNYKGIINNTTKTKSLITESLETDLIIKNEDENDLILALKYKPSYKGEVEFYYIKDKPQRETIISQKEKLFKYKMIKNSTKQRYIIFKTNKK